MNAACTIDSIKFPKYIREILSRSKMADPTESKEPGYGIAIYKRTSYAYARSLRQDCEKFINWANNEIPHYPDAPVALLEYAPSATHYRPQHAIVTVYDPLMLRIEQLGLLKGEIKK